MRKYTCIVLFSFFFCAALNARAQNAEDVHATGSNLLRVGFGSSQNNQGEDVAKRYLEEIANARIFFQYFSVGLRYEMDDPSEVGRSIQGLRRRWILYKKNQLQLQAGDVSALFGRGLAVNLFESRPLNYDSWLDGIYAASEYTIPKSWTDLDMAIAIRGVGGKEDFYPLPLAATDTTSLPMHIHAQSVNTEFSFFRHKLALGATFLHANADGDLLIAGRPAAREVNQPDFYADLNAGEFAAFAEWTENRTHAAEVFGSPVDTSHAGHAVYGSLSYSNSFLGLTFEYKNYAYFLHKPGDIYENVFSKLPISSPPEVYKEFTYTSITRSTHSVNFDDEVGMQLEANITAIPNVTLNLYGAGSSRHDKYKGNTAIDSISTVPNFKDNGFYPFWEIFAEAEWEFDAENPLDFLKFAAHRRSDVINYTTFDGATEAKSSTTFAAKLQLETTQNQSLLAILEHQWSYDDSRTLPDKRTLNELVTLQYSINPLITFGGLMDLSVQYELGPYHIEDSWFQGFVSLRLGESHTLLVSEGAERGGLNCTGGICRVVPPFKGLRLTLTSQI